MNILERLKSATGPDRGLNIAIFKFLHPEYADYVEGRGGLVHSCDGADQRVLSDVRPDNYTGSIDAALALVERMLPERGNSVIKRDETNFEAYIWQQSAGPKKVIASAEKCPSRALAILCALFTVLLTTKDTPHADK